MKKYTPEEISKKLSKLNDWRYEENKLCKTFIFKNFQSAFAFMREVAKIAEEMNHHPEWCNSFRRVEVKLMTHDAGGITDLDFELAGKMDSVSNT